VTQNRLETLARTDPCSNQISLLSQVSWIRKRDAHILTVDSYTFVADLRFQTYQIDIAEQFTLQVKYLQPRDSGRYECQVSTEPKMSHVVDLRVVGESIKSVW
jgi:Immunoglobulin V-set domain.